MDFQRPSHETGQVRKSPAGFGGAGDITEGRGFGIEVNRTKSGNTHGSNRVVTFEKFDYLPDCFRGSRGGDAFDIAQIIRTGTDRANELGAAGFDSAI